MGIDSLCGFSSLCRRRRFCFDLGGVAGLTIPTRPWAQARIRARYCTRIRSVSDGMVMISPGSGSGQSQADRRNDMIRRTLGHGCLPAHGGRAALFPVYPYCHHNRIPFHPVRNHCDSQPIRPWPRSCRNPGVSEHGASPVPGFCRPIPQPAVPAEP